MPRDPEPSGYDPEGSQLVEKRRTQRRRQIETTEYAPEEQRVSRVSRIRGGISKASSAASRNIRGFAKEIRTEGIRSGYKTGRSMERVGVRILSRGIGSRSAPASRSRGIVRYRPVTPDHGGLGDRTVAEISQGYTEMLDRDMIGPREERDFFGTSNQGRELISSKKKDIRYY